MCTVILNLVSKLYPINDEISRKKFLTWNFIATILYGLIFFSNLFEFEGIIISYLLLAVFNPIAIHYSIQENPKFKNLILCISLIFYLFIIFIVSRMIAY